MDLHAALAHLREVTPTDPTTSEALTVVLAAAVDAGEDHGIRWTTSGRTVDYRRADLADKAATWHGDTVERIVRDRLVGPWRAAS